jgi:uncharacterized membrane protein YphA (DoxX/SURF4 family)
MNTAVHAWLGLLARLVIGGVLLVAGGLKVADPSGSVEAVRAYELLPAELVRPVGLALPAVEVVLGLALVLGVLTRLSAAVSALLFAAFVVAIVSVWSRGIAIDCGCFGGGGVEAGAAAAYPVEVARSTALLAASAYLALVRRTRYAVDSVLFGGHRPDVVAEKENHVEVKA